MHGKFSNAASAELLVQRIKLAWDGLEECRFCEWRCGVDRTRGDVAPCRLGSKTHVFCQYLSVTEEPEVVPALRVYFGGCNFRCRFCDTAPECFEGDKGRCVDAAEYARELAAHIQAGSKTISVLGGEPTLHVHTLLELAAASANSRLPFAINTNLYMTPEVIEWLDGVASIYLGDFKFGNDACALQLAGIPRYFEVVTRNIQLIVGRTPLIVRHLLMPGHLDCCFQPVVDWLCENTPGIRFQLYTGYVPCWRAANDANIGRLNTSEESRRAVDYLRDRNLDWKSGADGSGNAVATISIGTE